MKPYHEGDYKCECQCGGHPAPGRRFISGHNLRALGPRSGSHRAALSQALVHAWATKRERKPLGSTRLDNHGYRLVKVREGGGRWDKEHILVMQEVIGRSLRKGECVHHINGIKVDNRPENLFLCASESEHAQIHASFDRLLGSLVNSGIVTFSVSDRTYRHVV